MGRLAAGFEEVHGGHGFGERNTEGERILEFAVANNLVVGNTWFMKRDTHLITYKSGDVTTQIDYILLRRRDLKLVKDIKVIPYDICVPQHKLLVCDLKVASPPQPKHKFTPKLRTWKLRNSDAQKEFQDVFTSCHLGL